MKDASPLEERPTTCADVSRKPSAVIATALPEPRRTFTLATEGESRSTTLMTAREYASSSSETNVNPMRRR